MAQNSSKCPGLYICTAVIFLLLAATLVAIFVYIVAFHDDDSDSETVALQFITRDGSLTYTNNMANSTYDDFKNVENAHCSEVKDVLNGSNCQVLSLTEGSVIIESVVEVKKKVNQEMADLFREVKGNLGRNGVNVQHTGLAIGKCKPTTCKNGGVCKDVASNQGICQCADGFVGIMCAYEDDDSDLECSHNQHKCVHRDGHCLDSALVCDTFVNCYDWSDELNCPPCDDIANITQCVDPPACLSPFLWCTGRDNCLDGSDNLEGCKCRDYQFECGDGPVKCIPESSVCNRIQDCADKSDELNCDCYPYEKICDSGLCMSNTVWCDGIDDCGDMSDELGCVCTHDQIQCDDGLTCFNKFQWCDGYPHCQDGSDEKDGCTCNEEQFACDGFCWSNSHKCDGTKDCVDATDEDCGCSGFQCRESLECLPELQKCNGVPTCADRSDEENCEDFCSQFTCDNGRCIEHKYVCDQHDNCGDGSDEHHCNYQCLDEEYKCLKGNCIPKAWLCDLIADCDDADDENREHCVSCNADQRPCRGGKACFAPDQHCDGIEQCPYGEDEHQCVLLDKESAAAGEALVVKATMEDVDYDGICSDNWSKAWTTAVCTYLSYESGESHEFADAPLEASLLVPQSSDPVPGQLLNGLSPGNCVSGKMVSVKCLSKECGTVPVHSNAFSPYIIHGEDAAPGQWPWQIQLLHNGYFQCGGSIIDHYWILTAAHCVTINYSSVHPFHASSVTIRAGANRLGVPDPNSRVYKVGKIIVHPAYDAANIINDIALMRVTESIEYTDYIRPACVADSSYDPKEAVECYISGWGLVRDTSDNLLIQYPLLQQAKMDILTPEYCDQVFQEGGGTDWPMENIHVRDATEICAGFPPKPITACYGDAGGPFVCRDQHFHWTLAGTSSWLAYCKGFSVYTRVSHYSEWVAIRMAENPPMN